MKAGGIASLPSKALKLLEHEVPTHSILSGEAGGLGQRRRRKLGRARIDPETPEPRSGTLRRPKDPSAKRIPSSKSDPFVFDSKWLRKRARRVRAHQQIAHNDAADLEDAVWHLWIDIEENMGEDAESSDADAASADRSPNGGQPTVGRAPAKMGPMSFIVDTGCGSNLVGLHYLRSAGAMGKLQQLKVPITLNTAGGPSRALGTVRIACDMFPEGHFKSIVMPETPGVLSVGALCQDHGFSFFWKAGKTPYLLLPNGVRMDLTVNGKIPYLQVGKDGAPSLVDDAAPARPVGFERWACVAPSAQAYIDAPEVMGGPPLQAVKYRTTLELHTLQVLAED